MNRSFTVLIFLSLLEGTVLAADSNNTMNPEMNTQPIVDRTYGEATGDENVSNWNNEDFRQNSGHGPGLIGNNKMFFQDTNLYSDSFSPDDLTAEQLQKDNPDSDVLQGWDSAFEAQMQSKVLDDAVSANEIRCFLARDIPFRYECSKTGIIFGSGMYESSSKRVKQQCESECYKQHQCLALDKATQKSATPHPGLELAENTGSTSKTLAVPNDRKVKQIVFDTNGTGDGYFYMDVTFDKDGSKDNVLVKRFSLTANQHKELFINDRVESFDVKIYKEDSSQATFEIKNLEVQYYATGRYICEQYQNVNGLDGGEFADVCPSGNTETVSNGIHTYTICKDGSFAGDNPDSTYSSRHQCESICRTQYSCIPNTSTYNSDVLKTFREGCMQGQEDCEDKMCREARKKNAKVVDETVYDGHNSTPVETVVSGSQVVSDRPRVAVSEDIGYQERIAREYKDEAYRHMIRNNTYDIVSTEIGQETNSSSAYTINYQTGADYGVADTSSAQLYWNYKPTNFQAGQSLYLYGLIEVIKARRTPTGTRWDGVLYLKTDAEKDNFKAVRVRKDYLKRSIDDSKFVENPASSWEPKTFRNDAWIAMSEFGSAEYFDHGKMDPPKAYERFLILDNMHKLRYSVPGLIRRIETDGPYETKYYTGDFDGTGESMLYFKVFTKASTSPLTYSDLFSMYDNKELKEIYGSNGINEKDTIDDTLISGDGIDFYLYGKPDDSRGYMQIRPDKSLVGKRGYLFLFLY